MQIKNIISTLNRIENNSYLYEGLIQEHKDSLRLWENAGFKLKEAALTADQINQIFQQVEQNVTNTGDNRTLLGKGKDAASAVNKAWEDLKTKIQNSGPIKNVDAAYDGIVAKIEQGLGGPDNAVNQVIQKYRKFAKEHPIAQSLIYSALIAAAGISGAGLGGAAVLSLLKMTDKLLQGEKFSSAAYQGAKTGAMAYGASKIGDLIKGKPEGSGPSGGDQTPSSSATDAAASAIKRPIGLAREAEKIFREKVVAGEITDYSSYQEGIQDAIDQAVQKAGGNISAMSQNHARNILKTSLDSVVAQANGGEISVGGPQKVKALINLLGGQPDEASLDRAQAGLDALSRPPDPSQFNAPGSDDWVNIDKDFKPKINTASNVASGITGDQIVNHPAYQATIQKFGDNPGARRAAMAAAKAAIAKGQVNESVKLSELQVQRVFKIIEGNIISEGIMDTLKGAAGKAANWAATKGKNLTTKITSDKLMSAWKAAGSPTDSEEIKKILQSAGVSAEVINKTFTDMKIPTAAQSASTASRSAAGSTSVTAPKATLSVGQINKAISTLKLRDLQSIQRNVDAILAKKGIAT